MNRPVAKSRGDFKAFKAITTRWADNDAYGHVNNVVYYAWFDTAVNAYLIENKVLDIERSPVIGLVVQTQCDYFTPISFPQRVTAGIRVTHIGTSSVRYEIGLFANESTQASAQGHFVHVYVDRVTRKTSSLPTELRNVLSQLL